ncbi:MAG: NAD-dependent epimerase/dehydratase family protein, partial [Bdellovibrionales bacterium]
NMRTAVLRIVGAFGERQDISLETGSVIPVLCRRAIEYPGRKPFTLLGQGLETRSYCYVGDVVSGLMAAADVLDKEKSVGPLNLGREGRVRILEIAKKIVEISGKDIEIAHLAAQESGIRGQAVDMTATLKQLSNWRPTVSLEEGLKICYADVAARLRKGEA